MAENPSDQNADWNRSGERQADQARTDRSAPEKGQQPPPADAPASDAGRDRAPDTGERRGNTPWLGGG